MLVQFYRHALEETSEQKKIHRDGSYHLLNIVLCPPAFLVLVQFTDMHLKIPVNIDTVTEEIYISHLI